MLNEKIHSLRSENYALWTLREAKLRVWSGEEFVRIWSGERFIARPSKENGEAKKIQSPQWVSGKLLLNWKYNGSTMLFLIYSKVTQLCIYIYIGLSQWVNGQRIHLKCKRHRRHEFDPCVGKKLLEEEMATHSSLLA